MPDRHNVTDYPHTPAQIEAVRPHISQPLSRVIGDGAPLTPEERAEIEARAADVHHAPLGFASVESRKLAAGVLRLIAALAVAEARAEAERAYRVARLAAIGEPNVHEAERRISETEAALRALGVEP